MFLEDPPFPGCPSFGYTSNPRYSTTISEAANGRERRNRNWSRPLYDFNVTVGPRYEEEIQQLLEFWHAMGGQECGFRFKDYADFKSCRVGGTATAIDQPTVELDDSPEARYLVKAYAFGSRVQTRLILKPVSGTIKVADNGVQKTEGVHWTLDYSTGRVDLNFSPVGLVTWGGEFDTPVRFNSEFPIELVDKKIESVTFLLRELRDPEGDS